MADIVTGTVSGQLDTTSLLQDHADIRREVAQTNADIRREVAKEASDINANVKEASWKVVDRVENAADRAETGFDRVTGQDTAYFIAGQQNDFSNATALAALKASTDAQFTKTQSDIALSAVQIASASQLAAERSATAQALGQSAIQMKIVEDGNATRSLINAMKLETLNRELIERNTALIDCRGEGRHWQSQASNAQFAAVSSQLNAFASQLQEVRQGTVNFGTMSGNAGRNTSTNNVV